METAPYTTRDFYGPLEIRSGLSRREDVEFYNHPTDSTKLVRFEQTDFADGDEMRQAVSDMRELLNGMTNHGITHVNPRYFDATSPTDDSPVLGMVVDKVDSHSTFQQLFENGRQLTDDEVYELDKTISAVCNYIADVEQSGGIIAQDALALRQFVYAPKNETGAKLVSVDVDPIALERLEPGKAPRHLTTLFIELFEDIIKIKSARSKEVLTCEEAVKNMIEAVPNSMPNAEELKRSLLTAWEDGTIGRLDNYFEANTEDEV